MAIYRGSGGSVESITESDTVTIAISQGGTGAQTAAAARTNLGLGSAATTDSGAYATAAQGTLADSAVQPSDIGTAATKDITFFATAAQGTLADSAVQPDDVIGIASGGTGQTTAATARAAILPTYASNGGKVLAVKSDASDVEYITVSGSGSGSVTSVAMSVPTGLSVAGSPITDAGTLAVTYTSGYSIPTTAKQTEWDTAYSDRNKWDGGATGLTAATGRTSLGLGTAATTAATDYATAAQGTKADTAYDDRLKWDGGATGLTASTGRTSLGVTATGSDTTYAYRANNLSDLASASTARTNLGLGTAATTAATDYLTASNPSYTGTLTGGTGVVNLGSGQFYKDASGIITGTAGNLMLVSGTAVTCAGQTSIDFTSIPSWVKRITIMFKGVSTSGTSAVLIQLGDSGGIENTGYLGAGGYLSGSPSSTNYTAGFGILSTLAANLIHGALTINLVDSSANTWAASGVLSLSNNNVSLVTSGSKSTSATLDRVRVTTVNGTDTFDTTPSAGQINIMYE